MTYNYPTTIQEAANILDKIQPDWFEKIHISTLRMDHINRCVLGQTFGEWNRGMCNFALGAEDSYKFLDDYIFGHRADVEVWKYEVTERRFNKLNNQAIEANTLALSLSADLLKLLPSCTVINNFLGNNWFVWTTKIGDKEWNSSCITKMSRYEYFNGELGLDQTVNY